jgi:hypothetical protein
MQFLPPTCLAFSTLPLLLCCLLPTLRCNYIPAIVTESSSSTRPFLLLVALSLAATNATTSPPPSLLQCYPHRQTAIAYLTWSHFDVAVRGTSAGNAGRTSHHHSSSSIISFALVSLVYHADSLLTPTVMPLLHVLSSSLPPSYKTILSLFVVIDCLTID